MKNIQYNYIYDIEIYRNLFLLGLFCTRTSTYRPYEISERRNDVQLILDVMHRFEISRRVCMVGFNNLGYDYPILHRLMKVLRHYENLGETFGTYEGRRDKLLNKIYEKSQDVIDTPFEERFRHMVWPSDQIVPQMDLMKIHHFDNKSKHTSLKALEFRMRMDDIQELPFKYDLQLTAEQIDKVISYNNHDINATYKLYKHSKDEIKLRADLSKKYGKDFMNHSDVKIGQDIFVMRLAERGVKSYEYLEGERVPTQTFRDEIDLGKIILPKIKFKHPAFQAIHRWFSEQTIIQTKGVFKELSVCALGDVAKFAEMRKVKRKDEDGIPYFESIADDLNVVIDDVKFVFGTGGIHASVHKQVVCSDKYNAIIDLDVEGFYPALGIAEGFYPEHLTEVYCDVATEIKEERALYPKKTHPAENKSLKLAGNGSYGNSNNPYSPFYDPKYTMSVTVNGQLMLCMLYDRIREIPGIKLIQVNTDGLTVKIPRGELGRLRELYARWEKFTKLKLEENEYRMMHIRDVNNYVALYTDASVKRKGAYEYELEWHKDHSAMIVKKAAEAAIVGGADIKDFIYNHFDPFDFFLCTKIPKSSRLVGDWGFGIEESLQNVTRYYIAKDGCELFKIMPPLKNKPEKGERRFSVQKGFYVKPLNKINPGDLDKVWENINYQWYVDKAKDLVEFKDDEY